MIDNKKIIKKLEKLVKSWGGNFQMIKSFSDSFHLDDRYYTSNGSIEEFIVFEPYGKNIAFEEKTHWADVIHAMGHVFASNKELQFCPGDNCYEFHGWEFAVVNLIQAPIEIWYKTNNEYIVSFDETPDDCVDFGTLNDFEKQRYLNQALERAKKLKIVDDEYKPLSIRG